MNYDVLFQFIQSALLDARSLRDMSDPSSPDIRDLSILITTLEAAEDRCKRAALSVGWQLFPVK